MSTGLDLGSLDKMNKELNTRVGGDSLFVKQKELTDKGQDFRIAEPLPNLAGKYFLEVIMFWINNKPYISPETFGEACVMTEEHEFALESKDRDLKALANDKDKIKKTSVFWIPGFFLTVELKNNQISSVTVEDDKCKVFECGVTMMQRINRVVTARTAQNGTPFGITDREKGRNMILSKTGKGLDTTYDAQLAEEWPMDSSLYDKLPDIVAIADKRIKGDDYLRAVIRNYYYGEPMPADDTPADTAAPATAAASTPARQQAAAPAAQEAEVQPVQRGAAAAPARTTPAAAPARQAAPAAPAGGGVQRPARNLMDDLNNID